MGIILLCINGLRNWIISNIRLLVVLRVHNRVPFSIQPDSLKFTFINVKNVLNIQNTGFNNRGSGANLLTLNRVLHSMRPIRYYNGTIILKISNVFTWFQHLTNWIRLFDHCYYWNVRIGAIGCSFWLADGVQSLLFILFYAGYGSRIVCYFDLSYQHFRR